MPALLFHQNMRNYGGNSALRNATFTGALATIGGITGASYWAAGFTECLNSGPGLRTNLSLLAQALDGGLTSLVVIAVGQNALGRDEYIGIAWDNVAGVNVAHVGQVLWNPMNRNWVAYNTPFGNVVNRSLPLPPAAPQGLDTRGLAYIAGMKGNTAYLIAFMHNMYSTGNKTAAFESLDRMATLARNTIGGGYVDATVLIGGDFNLRPRSRKRSRGADERFYARAALAAPGVYVNTTNVHPYDFWMVNNSNITDADARVFVQTRVVRGSDHAGITLNL